MESPLVLFASTAASAEIETLLSSSRVSDSVKYPESDPNASLGACILRLGVHTSPTPISMDSIPPDVSSLQVHPFGKFMSSTDRLQTPASLPVERMFGANNELSPGVTIVGSVGISKLALYGLTILNVVTVSYTHLTLPTIYSV